MAEKVLIKQFKNKAKKSVAGLTPEHAVYDANGVRLDAKLGSWNLSNIRDAQTESVSAVREAAKQYDHQTVINNGTITNTADEEDITVRDNVLSLKDRTYIEGVNEMGYVILRKNKSFAEQVTKENTIYEIRYDFDLNSEEIIIPKDCTLKFEGGSLNNGNVNGNNCFLTGNVKLINIEFTTPIGNTVIYASWFGAKGDGKTDDSRALKQMITALNKNGGTIIFNHDSVYIHGDGKKTPDGTGNSYSKNPSTGGPLQDSEHPSNIGRDITLRFINYSNLNIIGNGATIVSNKENGECKHNCIFFFGHCTNVYIENLNIDGQKEYRKPILNDYNTGNDVWDENYNWIDNPQRGYSTRGNMYIDKCANFQLNNVSSNNSLMDGICVGGDKSEDSHNIILTNCICKYNYRQGLTLSTVNRVSVIGGEYSYTGFTSNGENLGILPMAGIDVEADAYKSYNILISNASIIKNRVSGIIYGKDSNNIKTTLCRFEDKGINVVSNTGSNNEICYNEFYNCGCGIYQKNLKVSHNIFKFDANSKNEIYSFDTNDATRDDSIKSYFESNIIDVDLAGVSEDTSINCGGIRMHEDKTVIFKNNILKNITNINKLPVIVNTDIAENNQIILEIDKYPFLNNNSYNIQTIKKAEGNTIVGGSKFSGLVNSTKVSASPGVFSALINLDRNSLNKCYKITGCSFTIIVHTDTIHYKIIGDYNPAAGFFRIIYFDSLNGDITELPVVCYYKGTDAILKVDKINFNIFGYITIHLHNAGIRYENKIYTEIPLPSDIDSYFTMHNGSKINNTRNLGNSLAFNGLNVYDTNYKKFLWAVNGAWLDINGRSPNINYSGNTSQRPTLTNADEGFEYYDSTLKKKILWNGTAWVNIDGTSLE